MLLWSTALCMLSRLKPSDTLLSMDMSMHEMRYKRDPSQRVISGQIGQVAVISVHLVVCCCKLMQLHSRLLYGLYTVSMSNNAHCVKQSSHP